MSFVDRFWAKIDIGRPDECWPWTGGRYHDDYGMVGIRNQGRPTTMRAHAFALILATGEDAGGRFALHHCDNPPCCNPAHLYWGDQVQNIADMDRRGRGRRPIRQGTANGNVRLSEDDICEMRRLYATGRHSQERIAKLYGVSQPTVSGIIRGVTWSHLPH